MWSSREYDPRNSLKCHVSFQRLVNFQNISKCQRKFRGNLFGVHRWQLKSSLGTMERLALKSCNMKERRPKYERPPPYIYWDLNRNKSLTFIPELKSQQEYKSHHVSRESYRWHINAKLRKKTQVTGSVLTILAY